MCPLLGGFTQFTVMSTLLIYLLVALFYFRASAVSTKSPGPGDEPLSPAEKRLSVTQLSPLQPVVSTCLILSY